MWSLLRRLALPCAAVLAGCGSTSAPDAPDAERDTTRADLKAAELARGGDGGFAVRLAGPAPGALADAARRGPLWLALRRPGGLSFGGFALLRGDSVFAPQRGEFVYARARGTTKRRKDPVLLRLEGTVAGDRIDKRITVIPDPKRRVEGLDAMRSERVRILLGRGVDNLMQMKSNAQGGYSEYDTHGWVAVVDGDGNEVAWPAELAAAQKAADLDRLAPYAVLVRRWRAGAERPELFVRLALIDVIVAAQMKVTARNGRFDWTWEGVWSGALTDPPEPAVAPDWPAAPEMLVRYREYTPARRRNTSGLFRTLLAPVALGADIGAALFEETFAEDAEETSTLDRVRDRR